MGRSQLQTGTPGLPVLVCPPPPPTALPGLDQGRDACVHEIPFRFDLMGLLPQCQQLQMFFLLLSRGG